MRWEERLLDLFDDLEQQAEGLALIGRDAEVAELSRAEYAQVDLADRLHASEGRSVRFGVNGSDSSRRDWPASVRAGACWQTVPPSGWSARRRSARRAVSPSTA